jgi:hypothetical protein
LSAVPWAGIVLAILAAAFALRLTFSPGPEPKALFIHDLLRHGGE